VRGGKRVGAGRKTNLSLRQVWIVGAEYAGLLEEAAERQSRERPITDRAKCDILDAEREIRNAQGTINRIDPDACGGDHIRKDNSGEIDLEMNNIRPEATPDDVFRRARSYSVKRAYGVKAEIKAATIAFCRVKYGHTISPSKADECLKEFRRLLKRLRADTV
jgi:hypothetical protein